MLVALDLTARQAARVLAQAVRTRAKLEIEPRPESCSVLLWGSVAGREQDQLQIDLYETGRELDFGTLIGAMCDVRTILSGQLCIFSTFIVDASAQTVPPRVVLAVPDTIQVANRRRFARKAPTEPVPVRLSVPGHPAALVAILANIGGAGLSCRVVSPDLDDLLFIGDEIGLEFVLPWSHDVYQLRGCTCSKTPCPEDGHVLVGLEFVAQGSEPVLERLRTALNDETARLIDMDGDL